MPTPSIPRFQPVDLLAGFLVSLIALPLCLGISLASGFPAAAGVFTAIVGGLVVSFFGGSQLTIKGPAAGLIVIALGAVTELGQGQPERGYSFALACIVVAGFLQALLGLLRGGLLGEIFPLPVVKGMLMAIGIIVMVKQLYPVLGLQPIGKDLPSQLAALPGAVAHSHPIAAVIGLASLFLLVIWDRLPWFHLKRIPAPLLVFLLGIALGQIFSLEHSEPLIILDSQWPRGPQFMVNLPEDPLGFITFPDFTRIWEPVSIKYIFLFAVIGSLETLLSTRAVDLLDPWRRRARLHRDLTGVGVGNVLAALLGGLPMISEIIRSSANVSYGARTWWSNFFHGFFLLLYISVGAFLIQKVPLAALGAILVYTGFRLAHPTKFIQLWKVGRQEFIVAAVTIAFTITTDLLMGILAGTFTQIIWHLAHGLRLIDFLRISLSPEYDTHRKALYIRIQGALVFSNFYSLNKLIEKEEVSQNIVIDFKEARALDHTALSHLKEMVTLRQDQGGFLELKGLELLHAASPHPLATRYQKKISQIGNFSME